MSQEIFIRGIISGIMALAFSWAVFYRYDDEIGYEVSDTDKQKYLPYVPGSLLPMFLLFITVLGAFFYGLEGAAIAAVKPQIDVLLEKKDFVIVAIDGKCTSGKTTLAGKLAQIYPCNVFRMDDFFLRPEQRTPERFAEAGSNVDYERFQEELLLPLLSGRIFSYRPFDCSTFTLSKPVPVIPQKLNIIEGTYSHHPYFGDPYDMKILLSVDDETQRQRILQRPTFLHKRFFDEWIPMENHYFAVLDKSASVSIATGI